MQATRIIGVVTVALVSTVSAPEGNAEPAVVAGSKSRSLAEMQLQRVNAAIDGHIAPRFRAFADAADVLLTSSRTYCQSTKPDDWQAVKRAFDATVGTWAAVSHLQFGPLAQDARARRLSFWPDPRSVVWRQMRTVRAKRDPALLQNGELAKQSVAIQGLPALELLLAKPIVADAGASATDRYACGLAVAIARNIKGTAQDVLALWHPDSRWRAAWIDQAPSVANQTKHSAAMTDLVKALLRGFQVIRDHQVAVLQTLMSGDGRVSRLPYFRSGLTASYLKASIEGACELLKLMALGDFVRTGKDWMAAWLPNACKMLKQRAAGIKIPKSSGEFPGSLEAFDLRQLRFYANSLRQIIGREIASNAGVIIGFNELDGD